METRTPTQSSNIESDEALAAKHDIFQDPALAETMKDDPLFLFLKRWWLQISILAGAVIVGVYAKGAFDETYRAEMGRAADVYTELESRFEELPALEAAYDKAKTDESKATDKKEDAAKQTLAAKEKLDQGKARVESLLTSLADSKKPYSDLARVYRGALAYRIGDVPGAENNLSGDRWSSVADVRSPDRFVAELEALLLARMQLDQDSKISNARSLLKSLSGNGSFFDIAAGLALASASHTPEEKQEAKSALEALKAKAPEQSEVIDAAIERLG